jgi:hypothetical protein
MLMKMQPSMESSLMSASVPCWKTGKSRAKCKMSSTKNLVHESYQTDARTQRRLKSCHDINSSIIREYVYRSDSGPSNAQAVYPA